MPHQLAIFQRITSDQTSVSGSFAPAPIIFNNEAQDEGSNVSINGSGLITFANAGRYRLTVHVLATTSGYFAFCKNRAGATTGAILDDLIDTVVSFSVSRVFDMAASDTMECCVLFSSAGTIKFSTSGSASVKTGCATYLEIERLK
jgi:hypothetical protein